ncbi:hypothetical protein GUITHDRAFT_137374 [Guillardia theta CCMP2712]|uniref:Uncharacterized protein n=1 Tax=Guillardia theta (strain CCMP2712) TaxID=905079 RepID=L1JGY8_GUITC|nr:hypothetical protein GUITHDRAFT_137374 [Guillardia theta CCMP2712]EKX47602.1 hypothetical protein GUITHDRAFT_137374 [Guillardia theta CCMP2712]|eukprot:XP_005834582.1 hypothetical protein GUITHDRAFT_137374 [Guillardia theta CCMP2712]
MTTRLLVLLISVTNWQHALPDSLNWLYEDVGRSEAFRAKATRLGTSPFILVERDPVRYSKPEEVENRVAQMMVKRNLLRGGSTAGPIMQGPPCKSSTYRSPHSSVMGGKLQHLRDRCFIMEIGSQKQDLLSGVLASDGSRCDVKQVSHSSEPSGLSFPESTVCDDAMKTHGQRSQKNVLSTPATKKMTKGCKEQAIPSSTTCKKAKMGKNVVTSQMLKLVNSQPDGNVLSQNRTEIFERPAKKSNSTSRDSEHHGHVHVQKGCSLGCMTWKPMCMAYMCACITWYLIRIISFGRQPIRFCLSSHREVKLYLLTTQKLVGKSACDAETEEALRAEDPNDVWNRVSMEYSGNVPYKGKLRRLGCWVFNQVKASAADLHCLTPHEANLAAEGTPFLKQVRGADKLWQKRNKEFEWEARFRELCLYRMHHGTCDVPRKYEAIGFRWQMRKSSPCRREVHLKPTDVWPEGPGIFAEHYCGSSNEKPVEHQVCICGEQQPKKVRIFCPLHLHPLDLLGAKKIVLVLIISRHLFQE